MCNLYNITSSQRAMIEWTRAMRDLTGNLEPSIDVYPDYAAPIVRNATGGVRELAMVRWGLPSSQKAQLDATQLRVEKLRRKGEEIDTERFRALLKAEPDRGVTNVRNTASTHWRRWLGVENRCLVPLTSFAEPNPKAKVEGGPTPNAWFAVDESRPLAWFAGIWVPQWTGVRKIREGEVTIDLYAFLTTEPNSVVAPIHSKAMPVILTTQEETETWLTAPWSEAQALQRPLPADKLVIVEPPAQVEAA